MNFLINGLFFLHASYWFDINTLHALHKNSCGLAPRMREKAIYGWKLYKER